MSSSHRAASRRRSAPAPGPEHDGPASRSRGHRRKPKRRRVRKLTLSTAMLVAAAVGWFAVGPGRTFPSVAAAGAPDRTRSEEVVPMQAADGHTDAPAADRSDRTGASLGAITGLGPTWTAKIPADTRQLLVASGRGKDSSDSTVTLWTRTDGGGWQPGQSWPAHNAYKGWTDHHLAGDLRSPIGLYALTDAGGRKADPGSKLPYSQDSDFVMDGAGFNGESLAGSFDYVVAINYNRVAGRSPLDSAEPEGRAKGGGIWLHLDHGGPTHGCISLTEDHMVELIKALDPALHPVIAMGDADSLAT